MDTQTTTDRTVNADALRELRSILSGLACDTHVIEGRTTRKIDADVYHDVHRGIAAWRTVALSVGVEY